MDPKLKMVGLDDPEVKPIVLRSLLSRFRSVMALGSMLFVFIAGLDYLVYPEMYPTLWTIRVIICTVFLLFFLTSRLAWVQKHILTWINASMISAAVAICAMMFVTDGSESGYYQGLNLVLIALFTCNSFFPLSNLITGTAILGIYALSAVLHPGPFDQGNFASGLFFMSSTLSFVYVLTVIFSRQFLQDISKSNQIKLAAKELTEANQRLIENERLKDNFIANVSHELRTPLTLIMGPVQQHLDDLSISAAMADDFRLIHHNAELLLRRVNDLLDVSKLAAGEGKLNLTDCDLSEQLRFTCSQFESMAREHKIDYELHVEENIYASLDTEKFDRILLNLLSNAFKFTPAGGRIDCHLRLTEGQIELVVSDTGPGIAENLRQAVFDRFRQGCEGAVRSHQGTGLGLAIVKDFAELHGGAVRFEANQPEGSRFIVTLPHREIEVSTVLPQTADDRLNKDRPRQSVTSQFLAELASDRAILRSEIEVPTDAESQVHLPAVLVVEDHADMRHFICRTLNKVARLTAVASAQEALAALEQGSFDLIITDVMMPGMSGDQLVEAVRERPSLQNIPIMLLTAKSDHAFREKMLRLGANDYLVKPYYSEELKARAANLIRFKQVQDILSFELSKQSEDVVALTRELADHKNQALSALKSAEEASRLKDEFLMNLSHELRTPLTSILGWADLITSGEIGDQETTLGIETIVRNANSQLHLINDLLDVSRIIQGKISLEFNPCNLRDIVDDAIELVSATARARSIKIIKSDVWQNLVVSGDKSRMQQIVWNLLTNAIKFTPEGGEITLTLGLVEKKAFFSVQDTGIGIDPAFLPHVFDRLRQADSSTTKRHAGLGLGLAIVRHLVELHGGEVDVYSAGVNLGSTFTVTVPTVAASVDVSNKESISAPQTSDVVTGKHILVVDDHEETSGLLAMILERKGAIVSQAHSAKSALAMFDKQPVDLLISDLCMAEHDGFWLIEQIRVRADQKAFIPAIAISAHVNADTQDKALARGFHSFIAKPVHVYELLSCVGSLIQDKKHRGKAAETVAAASPD